MLQNNFTTPEQSKRLLELGVLANSADCYYNHFSELRFRCEEDYSYDFFHENFMFIPCWSVGRLMEIFDICFPESDTACWPPYYELDTNYITYVVRLYERGIMELDFSKLED